MFAGADPGGGGARGSDDVICVDQMVLPSRLI